KELEQFLSNPDKFIVARQKQIVTALCARQELREMARQIKIGITRGDVQSILRAESVLNRRTEEMVDKLSGNFDQLSRDEVKRHVSRTAEMLGGQTEAPAFRKAVLKRLTGEQLARQFGGAALAKVQKIYEQVLNGKSAADAVKQTVKNQVAVDIAMAIKQQRSKVEGFVAATAEEIGQAFQQLSIQPAYATHSKGDDGVEAINEALHLLEAAELAERVREAEKKLVES
ncbi:MAG TPA: hypothetical protein VFA15_05390, partial [Nitrososphaera sp.]|nr:hypothetical protein [Nitrososphaera sp.]